MGTSIEQFRTEESIRKSYYRNRGDLLAVIKDTNLPREYIEKCISKLKKSDDWKVNRLVSESITRELVMGRTGRIHHLMDTIKACTETEYLIKSTCHKSDTRTILNDNKEVIGYECLECGNLTDTIFVVNPEAHKLKLFALDELRKEDDFFVKFLEKMGFTERTDQPQTIIKNQQNIVVMNDAKLDKSVAEQVDKLSKTEQESIRLKIEKQLLEAEIVDVEDEPPTPAGT